MDILRQTLNLRLKSFVPDTLESLYHVADFGLRGAQNGRIAGKVGKRTDDLARDGVNRGAAALFLGDLQPFVILNAVPELGETDRRKNAVSARISENTVTRRSDLAADEPVREERETPLRRS